MQTDLCVTLGSDEFGKEVDGSGRGLFLSMMLELYMSRGIKRASNWHVGSWVIPLLS
jgi:hypothetical protein